MLKEPLLLSTFYDMFFPPLNMLICFRPMFDVADNCTLSSGLEGVDMICSSRYPHLVSFCLFSSVLEFLESLLLECSDCVVQDGADNICSVDCWQAWQGSYCVYSWQHGHPWHLWNRWRKCSICQGASCCAGVINLTTASCCFILLFAIHSNHEMYLTLLFLMAG